MVWTWKWMPWSHASQKWLSWWTLQCKGASNCQLARRAPFSCGSDGVLVRHCLCSSGGFGSFRPQRPVRREPWKLLMIFYGCHSSSTFKLCEMCFWLSSRSFLCLSGIRRFIWRHHSFGWREAWGLLCRCNPPTTFPELLHDSLRRLCLGPQITRQCCAIFLGLTLFLLIIYPFLFLHLKLWAFCTGIVLEKYWLKIDLLFFCIGILALYGSLYLISIGKVLVIIFFAFCIGILLEKSCFQIV